MVRTAHTMIAFVVNEEHALHHVHDRGYVESPGRIAAILRGISQTGLFTKLVPRRFSDRIIKEVHDSRFVNYIKRMFAAAEPGGDPSIHTSSPSGTPPGLRGTCPFVRATTPSTPSRP